MTCMEAENVVMAALGAALDSLGESSKKVLLYHLAETHGINGKNRDITVEEVEAALESLLGPAASIIATQMREHLVQSRAEA